MYRLKLLRLCLWAPFVSILIRVAFLALITIPMLFGVWFWNKQQCAEAYEKLLKSNLPF